MFYTCLFGYWESTVPEILQYLTLSFLFIEAEDGYLFEGDMVMSKEDIELSLAGGPSKEKENMFGLSKQLYKRWPNGVAPYTLDSSISKFIFVFKSVV